MSYGARLQTAMDAAGKSRSDLAAELGCTRQAVGLVLNNGTGRTLSTEFHAKAARFLGVDPYWLATGEGEMSVTSSLTSSALDIATLYDLIPVKDRVRRARAYNQAASAILNVLNEQPEAAATPPKKKEGV
ncbi:MAG: helix-turn-helix domain-containing protein [Hylemonella sp.]|jgi:transcriptional regulator with XRE-family HTH domain